MRTKEIWRIIFILILVGCGEETIVTDNDMTPTDKNVEGNGMSDEEMAPDSDTGTGGPGYQLIEAAYTKLDDPGGEVIVHKRYEIFRDQDSLQQFLTQRKGGAVTFPVVDFDKKMVVVLFNGKWNDLRPIYRLDGVKKLVFNKPDDVHSAVLEIQTTVLYYKEGCAVDGVIYFPTHIIEVEKAEFVNFIDRFEIVTDC